MRNRDLLESVNRAANGIIFCLRTQRNFRIHILAAVLVLFFSLWFHITKEEFLLVLTAIFLVLVTEIINTAVEVTIDLITQEYHPRSEEHTSELQSRPHLVCRLLLEKKKKKTKK